jgi:UDP-N-acetylmuramate dehydrogenase
VNVAHDVPLAALTTLGIGGRARRLVRVEDAGELEQALAMDEHVLVLGGGSNVVIDDAGFAGVVIQLAMRDVRIQRHGERAAVSVSAGVPWDDFVAQMAEAGLAGVECLSGIPGHAGATPMQNVGAYGQEVSDTIRVVRAYDRERREVVEIDRAACRFAYRASMFRGSARWIVLEVGFDLPCRTASMPIRYAELARALGIAEGETAPLAEVRRTVIELRRGKGMVIDPSDPESRSAGSFFTNPIVDAATSARLPPDAPRWPQRDGRVKLSAAWLIEHAGLHKGYTAGRVGISRKHALALVNRGGATAAELLELARSIQERARGAFDVELALEPIVIRSPP